MVEEQVNDLAAKMAHRLGFPVKGPKHPRGFFYTVTFPTEEGVNTFNDLFRAYVHELQTNWRPNLWGM